MNSPYVTLHLNLKDYVYRVKEIFGVTVKTLIIGVRALLEINTDWSQDLQ